MNTSNFFFDGPFCDGLKQQDGHSDPDIEKENFGKRYVSKLRT